jgi:AcrR family transcriptional regulator
MRARAAATQVTRARILDAGADLFVAKSYDEVTLDGVAKRAGVSLPTVLRHFGSKDALLVEAARTLSERERRARHVEPGDIKAAAQMLAGRYEASMPLWWRYHALEGRFPAVARAIDEARRGHTRWLADTFAPYLPAGRRARQALAELYAATEMYVWRTWRTHLGLTAAEAERALRDMLEALVARWPQSRRKR